MVWPGWRRQISTTQEYARQGVSGAARVRLQQRIHLQRRGGELNIILRCLFYPTVDAQCFQYCVQAKSKSSGGRTQKSCEEPLSRCFSRGIVLLCLLLLDGSGSRLQTQLLDVYVKRLAEWQPPSSPVQTALTVKDIIVRDTSPALVARLWKWKLSVRQTK